MKAVGVLEVYGFVPAVYGFDTMMKAADVSLLGKAYVGNGMQSISITGDVAAVTAAIEAGEAAVRSMGDRQFISKHIIANPDESAVDSFFPLDKYLDRKEQDGEVLKEEISDREIQKEQNRDSNPERDCAEIPVSVGNRQEADALVKRYGTEKLMQALENTRTVNLRKLAREYELSIAGREISKANKETLLKELEQYYKNNF